MKARAKLGVGTLVLVLGACDTLSAPSDDGYTFIDDPDASNTSGKGGGAGVSTAGVAGTAGTGGTTISPACPEVDLDGDGATVPSQGCSGIAVASVRDDCDDLDPSVQLTVYVDADGDGAGNANETACAPGPVPGFGYASFGNDCNDADADIGPYALDVSGDGVDRDCNGVDGGISCAQSVTCPCNEALSDSVGLEDACAGFDLTVYERIECAVGGCGGFNAYFRVANLGRAGTPGQVLLSGSDGIAHVLLESLGPGLITEPIPWPAIAGTIRVSSSVTGDCDPSNDVYDPATRGGLDPLCPK